jgi:hypothetical protein
MAPMERPESIIVRQAFVLLWAMFGNA